MFCGPFQFKTFQNARKFRRARIQSIIWFEILMDPNIQYLMMFWWLCECTSYFLRFWAFLPIYIIFILEICLKFSDVLWCSMMFYDVLWCSMMFYDLLHIWCSMMFYDVLWCSMMFYVLRAFLVSFCRNVHPEFFLVIFSADRSSLSTYRCVGHTAWAPQGRSQAGRTSPKPARRAAS